MRYNKVKIVFLTLILILAIIGGANLIKAAYYWWVLDIDDTISEYYDAPTDQAVDLISSFCDDGVCLEEVDWACGFSLNFIEDAGPYGYGEQVNQFINRFYDIVKNVHGHTKIRDVLKYNAKSFAVRVNKYSTPKECSEIGGEWGVLTPRPALHFK